MKQYSFNQQVTPPAPLVFIRVSAPNSADYEELPALIDTGAELTLIRSDAIEKLNLQYGDEMDIEGVTGEAESIKIFVVNLAFRGLPPITIKVGSYELDELAILGRDFLIHYRLIFDGPQLTLTIDA